MLGPFFEDSDQQGLLHFVEHMAFNGTKNFEKQELVDYLEGIGMRFGPDLNAYTSFDETRFTCCKYPWTARTLSRRLFKYWKTGHTVFALMVKRLKRSAASSLRSGGRARCEPTHVRSADSRAATRFALCQPHSNRTEGRTDTFDHASLRQFYDTWYRPDLMGFVAVGDFEPSYMESLASVYFSRLEVRQAPRERTVFPVPDHDETLFAIASDPEATQNVVSIYTKQDVRDGSTVGSYRRSIVERLYHSMLNQRLSELTRQPEPPFLGAGSGQGRWLPDQRIHIAGRCGAEQRL